jgi:hypothetical protein
LYGWLWYGINFSACLRALKIKKTNYSEDVMKKVFSVVAMIVMVASLSGCMDNPDGGNKKPANYGAGSAQQKG